MKKLEGKEVTYLPLHLALMLPHDAAIISISHTRTLYDERVPEDFKNVLRVASDSMNQFRIIGGKGQDFSVGLSNFVKANENKPIYVHCYYGESRSQRVAKSLVGNYGYTLVKNVIIESTDGNVEYQVYEN